MSWTTFYLFKPYTINLRLNWTKHFSFFLSLPLSLSLSLLYYDFLLHNHTISLSRSPFTHDTYCWKVYLLLLSFIHTQSLSLSFITLSYLHTLSLSLLHYNFFYFYLNIFLSYFYNISNWWRKEIGGINKIPLVTNVIKKKLQRSRNF